MNDCPFCFAEKDIFCIITKDGVIDRFKMVKNQEGKSQNVSDLISVTHVPIINTSPSFNYLQFLV
jgi:hypothetical protein